MIYIYSSLASLLVTCFLSAYLFKTKYFTMNTVPFSPPPKEDDTDEETEKGVKQAGEETLVPSTDAYYEKKYSIIIPILFFVISTVIYYLVYSYTVSLKEYPLPLLFVKIVIMNGIVGCAAITDHKRKKIPNLLILAGLISRLIIYVLEFIFYRDLFMSVLKNDGLGFLIGFVMLFVIAVITRGGIGFGDVKLFGIIGLSVGSAGVFNILFLTLIINSIAAITLMAMKKKTIRSTMPMAPFIWLSSSIICILGLF